MGDKEKFREMVEWTMSEMFFMVPDVDDDGGTVIEAESSEDPVQVAMALDSAGTLVLRIDRELLADMAGNTLGIDSAQVEPQHLRSVAEETANIIGGRYLREADPGGDLEFSLPAITEAGASSSSVRWHVDFICGGRVLSVLLTEKGS